MLIASFIQYRVFLIERRANFYEVLNTIPSATKEQIIVAHDLILEQSKEATSEEGAEPNNNSTDPTKQDLLVERAFVCLENAECRSEYTRFGSDLNLQDKQ